MAEKDSKKAEAKAVSAKRIEAKGPINEYNNAEVLRIYHDDKRKGTMDIRQGQILTVGEDITEEEANRLLNLNMWKFSEVKE